MLVHSVLSHITTPCSHMIFRLLAHSAVCLLAACFSIQAIVTAAQTSSPSSFFEQPNVADRPSGNSVATRYRDPQQGVSSTDLVRRALASNGDLAAARLNVERARGRLRQAGLRPNPTLDFEQTSERLTGAGTDRATSIGVAVPIELGGKRGRRMDLAQAELEAAEADVADRERRLAAEVGTLYSDALSALRELETTEGINNIDLEIARFVQIRVNEGDTSPLELNLIKVEVDRLRARRALIEGRLQSTLIKLKSIAGMSANEQLRLREDLSAPALARPPATQEAAIEIALRSRPDLKLARLQEEAAQAGLQLANANGVPNATVFSRYVFDRTITDLPTPLVPVPNFSKRIALGVSVGLPIFNRNQGTKAEALAAASQAKVQREFREQMVRAEVMSAYARYQAAFAALSTFEEGVITRSNDNIRVIRGAYEAGAFKITDLLSEQRRLVDWQRELTDTLSEQYRALVDLHAAIGLPVGENQKP